MGFLVDKAPSLGSFILSKINNHKITPMEIVVLLVMWAITIPICFNSAKKIGSNKTIAVLAGICLPIIAAIGYAYVASNHKST